MADETSTRWDRVREMLNRAHPEEPVYAGAGRFWNDLETLLAAEIHGVRMVAPPQPAAGCGCGHCGTSASAGEETGEKPRYPGRGAASGLIRGLRGQPPFDGSRLPRLPWGGRRMDDDDIRFISEWIDDGCPTGDFRQGRLAVLEATGEPERLPRIAVTADVAAELTRQAYAAAGAQAPETGARGEIRQRMNLDCMTDDQHEQLRAAFRELYALNKWPRDYRNYNNLALIHQDHCQHGWERFLPWHRIYLYEFEQAMQDVVPGVTMPYWDWTMQRYCPETPYDGEIIPTSFKGYITPAALEWLNTKADPALPDAETKRVRDAFVVPRKYFTSINGFFDQLGDLIGKRYTTGEAGNRFVDALMDSNSLWYALRFPAEYHDSSGQKKTINQQIHYHYPTRRDMDEIMSLRTFRDFGGGSLYNDAFGFLDQNPHNTMHIWTGGMNPVQKEPPTESVLLALEKASWLERNRMVRVAGRAFHTRQEFYCWRQVPLGDMFSNLTASYDPIFWPIHANIDRVWWEWQQLNPHAVPA
ncbi:MAG TPA: tyrosinase family protein, partial [Longimicrobiaceae bacterium]